MFTRLIYWSRTSNSTCEKGSSGWRRKVRAGCLLEKPSCFIEVTLHEQLIEVAYRKPNFLKSFDCNRIQCRFMNRDETIIDETPIIFRVKFQIDL